MYPNHYNQNDQYNNNYQNFHAQYNQGRGGVQWGRGGFNRAPAPGLEDQGFRNRGRGGNRRPQYQPAPQAVPQQPPQPAPVNPGPVPGPKHLSKSPSPLTNDPLYLESLLDCPGTEFRRLAGLNEHHPTTTGLPTVVEEDYKSLCAHSPPFAKNISLSMYNYYITIQTYARLLDIHRQNAGHLTFDESQFIERLSVNPSTITKTLELYLAGFGNTSIPGSADNVFVFDKPQLLQGGGLPGFFGPLQANVAAYHNYPSPGVAAQRLMEDLRLTAAPQDPPEWQLLADAPAVVAEGEDQPPPPQPTVKCVGYSPATRIRTEAVAALTSNGVTVDGFNTTNNSIPLNTGLLNWVEYYLKEVRDLVICHPPTSKMGSQAQVVTVTIDDAQDHGTVNSPFQINGSIVYLASCFKYRLQIPDAFILNRAPFIGANLANLQHVRDNYNADNPILNNFLYGSIPTDAASRLKTIVKLNFGT